MLDKHVGSVYDVFNVSLLPVCWLLTPQQTEYLIARFTLLSVS